MSKCHWCDEGRPFMRDGLGQHEPLYGGGEHSAAPCYETLFEDTPLADWRLVCVKCGHLKRDFVNGICCTETEPPYYGEGDYRKAKICGCQCAFTAQRCSNYSVFRIMPNRPGNVDFCGLVYAEDLSSAEAIARLMYPVSGGDYLEVEQDEEPRGLLGEP